MGSGRYTAITLYSGAGGLDLGFSRAGFDLLWANDVDRHACETYRANIGDHIEHGDVLEHEPPAGLAPDLVVGGPPCQGFSVAGRMDPDDPRSRHVMHFLDVVDRVQPRAFVMENVKALASSSRWVGTRNALLRRARQLGYSPTIFVLNAKDYGVPQARERMFLVGTRGAEPIAPEPTTSQSPPTVREALLQLPAFGEPGNDTICTARVVPASRPVMRPSAYRGSLMFNGNGRPLLLDEPARTLPASMGGNATPILDQEELANGREPWVLSYHRRLLAGGRPRKTAPARMRRITVEEAAALQTFPAGYELKGGRNSRYRQIGNAVPPNLAYQVAVAIRRSLEIVDSRARDERLVAAAA